MLSAIIISIVGTILAIPMLSITLAIITSIRNKTRKTATVEWSNHHTSIYSGRVWHTRFRPIFHSFTYPLFFFCLDLKEVNVLFTSPNARLWPLTLLMKFRTTDHLKNKEGLKKTSIATETATIDSDPNGNTNQNDTTEKQQRDENPPHHYGTRYDIDETDLAARIRNLIWERTNGKYEPSPNQSIFLLTHLSYFGYCFNPVSFYYVMTSDFTPSTMNSSHNCGDDGKNQIEAIVAEVSNTPWNEMQCYVLHPESMDITKVLPGKPKKISIPSKTTQSNSTKPATILWESVNYIFDKAFHVSPFMDMNHTYDWTFYSPTFQNRIIASTTMRKEKQHFFNAYFDISRSPFTPLNLCYQLIRLPIYCLIIQIWIHFEAFRLFFKGVEFIPHPLGSETAASNIIAFIMTPFFAISDWWKERMNKSKTGDSVTHHNGELTKKSK